MAGRKNVIISHSQSNIILTPYIPYRVKRSSVVRRRRVAVGAAPPPASPLTPQTLCIKVRSTNDQADMHSSTDLTGKPLLRPDPPAKEQASRRSSRRRRHPGGCPPPMTNPICASSNNMDAILVQLQATGLVGSLSENSLTRSSLLREPPSSSVAVVCADLV